jgi:membrane-bound metal-dependent hydrolase YbcI (DUF457 family)
MFIGHYGLAFGAKRFAPEVSLGTTFLACQLADLIWPTLVLTGLERVTVQPGNTAVTPLNFDYYPYSHSLTLLALWGLLLALLYRITRSSTRRGATAIFLLVLSHWALDWIVHRPDLPIVPGLDARFGLGLWSSLPGTLLVEFLLFASGVVLYYTSTLTRDRVGSIACIALVLFLAVVELANLLGPPPPNPTAVAWSAEAMWLLVAWAYWVDRHRSATHPPK